MFLEQIGADDCVLDLFRPYRATDIHLGRVCFAAREQYRIFLEWGECDAVPTGRLRCYDELPAVGDWVAARRADASLALIEAVLPRRTQFSRRAPGAAAVEQVLAANIDLALVVCGLDDDFNLRRIERYLVLARESGAEPLVVLNKCDLRTDPSDVPSIPGVATVAMSAQQSVEPLRGLVRGRTSALLGSSGAGKSTIVNGLMQEDRQATRPVRASDSRGRHTTTARMLLPLPGGGAIVDNPGLRELQLWASGESLEGVFEDIAALAAACRFTDCSHTTEPGCAVRGQIDPARWQSFCKLQAELRHRQTEQDANARAAVKRKWKAIHKAMRHHPKYGR